MEDKKHIADSPLVNKEEISSPVNPSPSKYTHQNTRLLMVLLVMLVVLLGTIYLVFVTRSVFVKPADLVVIPPTYNVQPTTVVNDINTWQTYRNDEYGFEFKYPSSWINKITRCIESRCGSTGIISSFGEDFFGTAPGGPIPLTFTVSRSLGDNTITKDPEAAIVGEEDISIDTKKYLLKTYKRFQAEGSEEISEIIEVSKQNKTLYLIFTHSTDGCLGAIGQEEKQKCIQWNKETLSEYQTIRNQILSTFRFIDQFDTSTWQTYRNEEYGFEFKYPVEFEIQRYGDNNPSFLLVPKKSVLAYDFDFRIIRLTTEYDYYSTPNNWSRVKNGEYEIYCLEEINLDSIPANLFLLFDTPRILFVNVKRNIGVEIIFRGVEINYSLCGTESLFEVIKNKYPLIYQTINSLKFL